MARSGNPTYRGILPIADQTDGLGATALGGRGFGEIDDRAQDQRQPAREPALSTRFGLDGAEFERCDLCVSNTWEEGSSALAAGGGAHFTQPLADGEDAHIGEDGFRHPSDPEPGG